MVVLRFVQHLSGSAFHLIALEIILAEQTMIVCTYVISLKLTF